MYLRSHKLRTALWSCLISGLVVFVLLVALTVDIKNEYSEMTDYDIEAVATALLAGAGEGGYKEDPFIDLLNLDPNSYRSPHYDSEEYVLDEEKSILLMAVQRADGSFSYVNKLYWNEGYIDLLEKESWAEIGESLPVNGKKAGSLHTMGSEKDRWEMRVYRKEGVGAYLAINQKDHKDEYLELVFIGATVLPIVAVVVALGGWWLGYFAVKPITSMSRFVSSIKLEDLGKRMPQADRTDEIGELARFINDMLERIEGGYEQSRRFTADASHELRTPLAILQGELEAKMRESDVGIDSNTRMLEEIRRLKALTHSLLFLSKTDSGTFEITCSRFDLCSMVQQTVDDFEEMYKSDGISISYTSCDQPVFVSGDSSLIQQAFMNLLRNAMKFNRPNGKVVCTLSIDAERVSLSIGNYGPIIPAEFREKVFKRFFRMKDQGSHEKAGFGLGLNIAREIARAHKGDVKLFESNDDWTEFVMTFPQDC